ncbi:hypothetical protein [Eikenella corrodens]|uniref:hypothetical protein n=1 Tax=Eikenella corrodens TaxID=539 RepID=UPI0018788EE2|nr:hypothetical protein [Eikenella corrodens]
MSCGSRLRRLIRHVFDHLDLQIAGKAAAAADFVPRLFHEIFAAELAEAFKLHHLSGHQLGVTGQTYDGSINYNGSHVYGAGSYWAHYRIIMNSVITNDQAALLRKTLAAFAPARCLLAALDYQAVPLRYNGRAAYDGNFNFGAA